MRHGTCFRRRLSTHHAPTAPPSAVAELEVVRRFPFSSVKARFILFAFLSLVVQASAQQDNRIKPGIKVGDAIPDYVEEVLLSEAALRAKIASFQNEDLTRSVAAPFSTLKWQRRIALRDADYILCLFDSSTHSEPGDNPRALILLTPDYKLKTWGRFTCAPFFAYGSIVSPIHQPNTYFVTINPSGRFGGTLFFEKYLIDASGIRKLGEGYEITKIPDK